VYPVYIDPGTYDARTQASWLDVAHDFSGGTGGSCSGSWGCWGNWDYTDPAGGIRAGVYCSPDGNGNCVDPSPDSTWGVYRSYLNFAVPSGVYGAVFVGARLTLNEVWSWSCTASKLEMYQTTRAVSGETWANRPNEAVTSTNTGWQDSVTTANGWSGTSGNCPVAPVTLNANAALNQVASDASQPDTVTLELRASLADEQASPPLVNTWKRFQATASSGHCPDNGAPCLKVFWMHEPNRATVTGTEQTFSTATGQVSTHCATASGSPDYVGTARPWLDGSVTDQDSGVTLTGKISWTDVTQGATGNGSFGGGAVQQDGSYRDQAPAGVFADGQEYQWQAYGEATAVNPLTGNTVTEDGPASSGSCYVTVDTSPPAGTVTVTSNVYTSGTASGKIGEPGTFTFADPAYSGADSDVVGYFYGIDNSQPSSYVAAANGTASITVTPYTSSEEDLDVQAVDRAGNRGPLATNSSGTVIPSFKIIPSVTLPNIATMGYWTLDNTSADASGNGGGVALAAGGSYPCGSANPPGHACWLAGEADANRPVVSNEAGFTVSAWVYWAGCASYCVAMSQDESGSSGDVSTFALGWEQHGQQGCTGTTGCWTFAMNYAGAGTALDQAQDPVNGSLTPGWVQLTGVFDPLAPVGSLRGTLTLYVNDTSPAAQFAGAPDWTSTPTGVLRLGAGFGGATPWRSGSYANLVSDACAFYGALQPADVATLYAGNSTSPDGCSLIAAKYESP
jgi:hypothetical protein